MKKFALGFATCYTVIRFLPKINEQLDIAIEKIEARRKMVPVDPEPDIS